MNLKDSLVELLRRASTDLSPDVKAVLERSYENEEPNTPARGVFQTILKNIDLAKEKSTPMCQDTGSLIFYIDFPRGESEEKYISAIQEAAMEATNNQYLRPNAVDPILGKNSGNNIGINTPFCHFHQWNKPETRIRLMLKGGGSENVGAQYKLPHPPLKAGRDLNGVRKVIIDAVLSAQGLGCAPGILGVGIGGDRITSYLLSKEQFFRKIGERHPEDRIAQLETDLLQDLNKLKIGPMGFGGNTTILDLFIDYQHRHPATFFVSISYMCWAFRRKTLTIKDSEVSYD